MSGWIPRRKLPSLTLAAAGLVSLLSIASAEDQLYTFRAPAMGTEFTIRVWAQQGQVTDLTLLSQRAFARVNELNQICSDYLPESELNRLAQAPRDTPIPVSKDLFSLFTKAGQLTTASDGAFDITAGPLIRLWRISRKTRRLPTDERRLSALARTSFAHLSLDPDKRTITKHHEGMLFDLGGIAKGYAADAILLILKEAGYPRSLVAASGDIVVGDPPPGEPGWTVGIEALDVDQDPQSMATVLLVNQAISTSGDARQHLELDGVRYSHIVSTKTGLGLTRCIAATVIAPNATTSDSHATAVVLLGEKDGLQFIGNQRGIECRIVIPTESGERITRSAGFPSSDGLP
jgi:thiamine biosynthesis lipoprotein